MQRQRGDLVPIGEALADLPGPVQALIPSRSTQHHFTLADQVDQLVRASETTPDLGFMARMLVLCSLPRTNPGNRHQYKRQNGPYTLYMFAGRDKLPYGNLPRLILAWVCSEAVRGIERKAGEVYRSGVEGSEERAHEAARTDGISVRYGSRPVDWYRLKRSVSEERMEQVREIDGELAYKKMRRAVEKASQEKARQVEWARQETARQSRERRGPERDFGPAASLVLLRGCERMERTDWEEASEVPTMAVMLSKTYAAFKAAGAPDAIAREAAEEIAGFENRLSAIESDVKLLKWMVGTNIVLTFGVLLRLFTAS